MPVCEWPSEKRNKEEISDKVRRAREYRETLGIGLQEAVKMVEKEDLLGEIESLVTTRKMKDVLRKLANVR